MVLTELRCQTEDMGSRAVMRTAIESQIELAAKLGHELAPDLERVQVTKNGWGIAARCSCGWLGHPKSKRIKAFHEGYVHLGECIGEYLMGPIDGGVGGRSPDRAERLARVAERSAITGEVEPASLAR